MHSIAFDNHTATPRLPPSSSRAPTLRSDASAVRRSEATRAADSTSSYALGKNSDLNFAKGASRTPRWYEEPRESADSRRENFQGASRQAVGGEKVTPRTAGLAPEADAGSLSKSTPRVPESDWLRNKEEAAKAVQPSAKM